MPAKANLEILFSRQGAVWRLRVHGWPAPDWRPRFNDSDEAFPAREPDLVSLDDFMRKREAPYVQTVTALGIAIECSGRSAVALWEWLDRYLIAG